MTYTVGAVLGFAVEAFLDDVKDALASWRLETIDYKNVEEPLFI